jgi:hypothetical protein
MVSNFDYEIWIAKLSPTARNRQCMFRKGLGPKTEICSVISVAAEANWPAMADDMLNMRTRSGSRPICCNNSLTLCTLRLALVLPSR